jgi:hypothetical protein
MVMPDSSPQDPMKYDTRRNQAGALEWWNGIEWRLYEDPPASPFGDDLLPEWLMKEERPSS